MNECSIQNFGMCIANLLAQDVDTVQRVLLSVVPGTNCRKTGSGALSSV